MSDLAARIKSKYPQYEGVDDAELERLFIAKNPEYADRAAPEMEVGGEQAMSDRSPSNLLDTAIGVGLTSGAGLLNPEMAQKLGRGASDASAKMLLTARKVFGMEPEPAMEPKIREQLQSADAGEAVGQMVPGAALAVAAPGSSILSNAAVGGALGGLDSGDLSGALTGAALSGGASGLMRGVARAAEAPLLRSIDKSADAAMGKMGMLDQVMGALQGARGAANVAGGRVVRGGGQILDAVSNLPGFAALSARAKVNLLNTLRSADESKILQAVWRLLPTAAKSETEGNAPATIGDMRAEAMRRRNADAVISR